MLLGWVVLLGGDEGKKDGKRWLAAGGWVSLRRRSPMCVVLLATFGVTLVRQIVLPHFFFFLSGGLWCRGDTADGVSSGSWMGVEAIVGFNEPYRPRFRTGSP